MAPLSPDNKKESKSASLKHQVSLYFDFVAGVTPQQETGVTRLVVH